MALATRADDGRAEMKHSEAERVGGGSGRAVGREQNNATAVHAELRSPEKRFGGASPACVRELEVAR